MSLELVLVFALATPPSAEQLQSALDRQGIPVRVTPADLQRHTGLLPVDYEARKSGFFVTQLTYDELIADYPQAKGPSGAAKAVVSLSWGADFLECASVFQVASVLVSDFGASAFDTESASYLSLADVKTGAVECHDLATKQPASR